MTPRNGLYGDPVVLFERMKKRTVLSEGGCWLFTGALNSRGYSCVGAGMRSKSILGHRLAVIARDGDLDPDMTVDHMCEVKRCVNPAHLQVVTRGENQRLYWRGRKPAPVMDGPSFDFDAIAELLRNRAS